jgi:DNA-directed RNA polymerase specialized sigma24 family protein
MNLRIQCVPTPWIPAFMPFQTAALAARAPLPVPVLPDLPDRCLGPEETVLKSVDARLARTLLAHLPAAQRRLLLLRVAQHRGPGPAPGAGRR